MIEPADFLQNNPPFCNFLHPTMISHREGEKLEWFIFSFKLKGTKCDNKEEENIARNKTQNIEHTGCIKKKSKTRKKRKSQTKMKKMTKWYFYTGCIFLNAPSLNF